MTARITRDRSELSISGEFVAFLIDRYPRSVQFFVKKFEAWKEDRCEVTYPALLDMDGDDYDLVASLVAEGLLFDIRRVDRPETIWIPIDPMDPHEYWVRIELYHYYDDMCSGADDATIPPYDWLKHHLKRLKSQLIKAQTLRPTVESYDPNRLKKAQRLPPTAQRHGQIRFERECPVCRADLKDRNKKVRFCSGRCRTKAHRERKKLRP